MMVSKSYEKKGELMCKAERSEFDKKNNVASLHFDLNGSLCNNIILNISIYMQEHRECFMNSLTLELYLLDYHYH